MIEKTASFKTSDGGLFTSVEGAQEHELSQFLKSIDAASLNIDKLPGILLAKKDDLIILLTMKASSRPKARKSNGATRKPRAAAPSAAPVAGTK